VDKVLIIIPAHNEENHVGNVVRGAKKYGQVIVVDDGSTDNTSGTAYEAGAKVFKLSKNRGKGYALRFGAKKAIEMGANTLVFMDADEQHNPEDIPKFLKKYYESENIVFGQRQGEGKMPFIKKIGNWGIGFLFKSLFKEDPKDMLCGFKTMNKDSFEKIIWKHDGYEVEIEMLVNILKNKLKIEYVDIPIVYLDRKKGTTIKDGVSIVKNIIKIKMGII